MIIGARYGYMRCESELSEAGTRAMTPLDDERRA